MNINNIYLFFWLFLIILTPQFLIFGVVLNSFFLAFAFPAFYYLISYKVEKPIIDISLIFIPIIIFFLAYGVIAFYELPFFWQDFITFFIVLISVFFFARTLVKLKSEGSKLFIIKLLLLILTINTLIIFLCVLSEEFKSFFYSLVNLTDRAERFAFGSVLSRRFSGFHVSGFTNLSIIYFICLTAVLYLMHKEGVKNSIYIFFVFLNILGLIFIARTGLILTILSLLIYLILSKRLIFFCFIFLVPVVALLAVLINQNEDIANNFAFAFDIFLSLYETGELRNTTVDALISEITFPPLEETIIFGNGNFGRGMKYINSDSGIILIINAVGIIGLSLMFLTFCFFSFYVYRNGGQLKSLVIFLSFFIFFMNFKDFYFIGYGYIELLLLFTGLDYFLKKNEA